MKLGKQTDLQGSLQRTETRLHEISKSADRLTDKQTRASVNLCSLLEEIATESLSEEDQARVKNVVDLFMHLG